MACNAFRQVKGGMTSAGVRAAAASGGVIDAFVAIGRHEGIRGYWKGNLPQVGETLSTCLSQSLCPDVVLRMHAGKGVNRAMCMARTRLGSRGVLLVFIHPWF